MMYIDEIKAFAEGLFVQNIEMVEGDTAKLLISFGDVALLIEPKAYGWRPPGLIATKMHMTNTGGWESID
jgi:hypothetical protein